MTKENLTRIGKVSGLDVSICIISYNGKEMLEECLHAVYKNIRDITCEVLVVDNNSCDGSVDMIKSRFPYVHVIENKANYGFAKANNQAIRRAVGKYILLLNQDVVILDNNAIKIMKEFLDSRKEAAVCGCSYINSDGASRLSQPRLQTIQHLFNYYLQKLLCIKQYKNDIKISESLPQEVGVVIGACFMIKKEAVDKIGLLDEAFFFYFEEMDWCLRIKRAGWKIYILPWIYVRHHLHSRRDLNIRLQYQYYKSQHLFFKKHYGRLSVFLLLAINEIVNCLKLLYAIFTCLYGMGNKKKRMERFIAIRNAFHLLWLVNNMPL